MIAAATVQLTDLGVVMFSHIMLGANDVEKSKVFYDAILATIGFSEGVIDPQGRCFYLSDDCIFALSKPIDGQPAGPGNGSTIGFDVTSVEMGNAWHAAGLANGGTDCEDAPGVRGSDKDGMYLAYLRDPSGNKLCALYRMG